MQKKLQKCYSHLRFIWFNKPHNSKRKMTPPLRSPREKLGGYIFLPRLIDKVRLHAQGRLPAEYIGNLLKPGLTTDGRFLEFTGLDGEELRNAILATDTDADVLSWVLQRARASSDTDKRQWAEKVDAYRPDANIAQLRKKFYPDLAKKVDVTLLSVFDLIDMDEGRIPYSG